MRLLLMTMFILTSAGWAFAQSSSLFLRANAVRSEAEAAATQPSANGAQRANAGTVLPQRIVRNPVLASASLTAITAPEPEVIQVNDLLGIVVRHRLNYQSTGRAQQNSQWDLSSKLNAWFRLTDDHRWVQQGFRGGTPEIDFENENKMRNNANFDRRDTFETRVMARVIDVKPNGNLVVMARQKVKIEEEDQYVVLTGECSKNDIAPNRTITSDKVFDLDVRTENAGSVRDGTKRGWFKGGLDRVKPF